MDNKIADSSSLNFFLIKYCGSCHPAPAFEFFVLLVCHGKTNRVKDLALLLTSLGRTEY